MIDAYEHVPHLQHAAWHLPGNESQPTANHFA
jgi:hypothetical protein